MSFKENLIKKMEINALTRTVLSTIGPVGSSKKVDRLAMDRLLNLARYTKTREREIDLYCRKDQGGNDRIFVLDNDLNIYQTTMDDVLLRKNPFIKEMISIRNAIKILNDKDVVVSKKEDSVLAIEKESIDFLDLTFDLKDIEGIENDGVMSLEIGDTDTVLQSIDLFSEVLAYQNAPKSFRLGGYMVKGGLHKKQDRSFVFGPIVIYNSLDNDLRLVEDRIESHETDKIELLRRIAMGKEKADMEGAHVFQYLKKAVVFNNPEIQ